MNFQNHHRLFDFSGTYKPFKTAILNKISVHTNTNERIKVLTSKQKNRLTIERHFSLVIKYYAFVVCVIAIILYISSFYIHISHHATCKAEQKGEKSARLGINVRGK